jgi:CheY-like chemotaxis protein
MKTSGLKILILDDDEVRHQAFAKKLIGNLVEHVRTAEDTIYQLIHHGPWDMVFLDHDLGGQQMVESGQGTGYEVAKWLSENKEFLPGCVIIHSYNPAGAKNMLNIIPGSRWIPGIWNH